MSTANSKKPAQRRYQNVASHSDANQNGADPLAFTGPEGELSECASADHQRPNQMSVDDAIDRLGMGTFQYRILVAAGLCFAADAMEVLLLSFLSIILQNEWNLSEDETAFITSTLFLGALVGTLILGPLADRIGRRPVFLAAGLIISVMGVMTAFALNYEMLLAIMFVIGFGIGGLTVPFDTLAEFLPAEGRGTNLLLIEYFWTIGCLLVIVFAELTLAHGKLNWRLFVFLCALPCFVSVIVGYLYCPESVRWLASVGRGEEALEILRDAARVNKLTAALTQESNQEDEDDEYNNSQFEDVDLIFPLGTEITSDEDHGGEDSASCADLMKPQWRGTILKLWGTWGGFGLGYYGAILSVTKVFDSAGSAMEDSMVEDDAWFNTTFYNETFAHPETRSLEGSEDFDYNAIFISSSAELVGTTLVIILVDRVGRIPSQVVCYLMAGACIFLLCTIADQAKSSGDEAGDRWELVGLGFVLRAMGMAATCASWVMTAEVLSTEIRTTGHASANALARIGAFFSPFLVDILPLRSLGITMLVVHWFAAACVSRLPETKGAQMGGGGGGGSGGGQNASHDEDFNETMQNEEHDGIFVIEDDDDDEDADGNNAQNGVLHNHELT